MPELTQTRRKLKIAIGVLAALDVIALGVLFSPLVGSAESHGQQLSQLGTDIQIKSKQVEPLRGLDKKIPLARQEISDFYNNRLTSEDSAISADLVRLASESGVKLNGLKYAGDEPGEIKSTEKVAAAVGLHHITLEADLSGDYLQLMRFINSLERNKLFFVVDNVQLAGEQGGTVKLEMKLDTYIKTGTA